LTLARGSGRNGNWSSRPKIPREDTKSRTPTKTTSKQAPYCDFASPKGKNVTEEAEKSSAVPEDSGADSFVFFQAEDVDHLPQSSPHRRRRRRRLFLEDGALPAAKIPKLEDDFDELSTQIVKPEDLAGAHDFDSHSSSLLRYANLENPSTQHVLRLVLARSYADKRKFRNDLREHYFPRSPELVCMLTGSRLGVEGAHAYPFFKGGPSNTSNGLLLCSDLHRLFDTGEWTLEADLQHTLYRVKLGAKMLNDVRYQHLRHLDDQSLGATLNISQKIFKSLSPKHLQYQNQRFTEKHKFTH
jgi:hypothetical protein